jgi:hypothetical protein
MAAEQLVERTEKVHLELVGGQDGRARPATSRGPVIPLPLPAPMLHPEAVEALLLAFRPAE